MLVIPIVLAIMLSILGLAYAHWQDEIKINGTVNTGTLNVGFIDLLCVDKEFKENLLKDVGDCDCWLDEWVKDEHTGKEGYKKLWINVTNGYPSYYCEATFVIQNLGTVPAIFKNFTIYPDPPLKFVKIATNLWEARDTSITGEPAVFNLELVNLVDLQLDPCNKTKAEVDIHFKQSAPECHTYTFHIEIGVVNWDP